jgi:hypothetical protein
MDRFKNNIENVIFSNKTQFIKNRRQGSNSGSNSGSSWFPNWFSKSGSNSGANSGSNSGSNFTFDGILLWIPLFIMVVIISYLTVMTAKYLTTECSNKRSWFNYIIRFCYNDVCLVPKTPIAPVVNNVHFMKPGDTPPPIPNHPGPPNNFGGGGSPLTGDQPSAPKQEVKKSGISIPLFDRSKKEVFHIANQDYTFEQAKCKCESYNAKLASYDQLVDAYNDGAEWCTYGWSNGQKAYYPTQKCNWEKKGPEEKLKCGNPGLNGGFFADPSLKFGVNCYGKKPKGRVSKLKDPVCNGGGNYCQLPQNFGASNRLETDEISPFNIDKWNN